MFANEGIAFDIEEDVALRWLGKQTEPDTGHHRQQFMAQFTCVARDATP